MKKLFLALAMSLGMASCGSEELSELTKVPEKPFVEVDSGHDFGTGSVYYIFADKETNVMYMYINGGKGGGLTVLVNPDGTPRLYDGELEDN